MLRTAVKRMRTWVMMLALAVSVAAVLGQASPQEMMKTADHLFTIRDFREAATAYYAVYKAHPDAPEAPRALMRMSDCFALAQEWEKMIGPLEALRKNYPNHAPDRALSTLCIEYLYFDKQEEADGAWVDLLKRAPMPPALNDVIAVDYKLRVKADAEKVRAACATTATYSDFSPDTPMRERLIWFKHLRATKLPEEYIKEAKVAVEDALKGTPRADTLVLPLVLTIDLYRSLMEARRFDEAKAIHLQLLTQIIILDNPRNYFSHEISRYYNTLAEVEPDECTRQLRAYLTAMTQDVARTDAATIVSMLGGYYRTMREAGKPDDVEAIHTLIRAALEKLGYTDTLAFEQQKYDETKNVKVKPKVSFGNAWTLFKLAVAQGDYPTAKKHYETMLLIDPANLIVKDAEAMLAKIAPK